MQNNDAKHEAIRNVVTLARAKARQGMNYARLNEVLVELIKLGAERQWWHDASYPAPQGDALQARYWVHVENDDSFAMYLNVMKPGKRIVPHNHTTWALIAAVEGAETNYLYERLDDGSKPGFADVRQSGEKVVAPGGGIALLDDDIHAVHIKHDSVIRHLHMYGRALETLDKRLCFDIENKTCRVMDVGVKTRQAVS